MLFRSTVDPEVTFSSPRNAEQIGGWSTKKSSTPKSRCVFPSREESVDERWCTSPKHPMADRDKPDRQLVGMGGVVQLFIMFQSTAKWVVNGPVRYTRSFCSNAMERSNDQVIKEHVLRFLLSSLIDLLSFSSHIYPDTPTKTV